MQFQQHIDDTLLLGSLLVYLLEQFQRVNSLNHRHIRGDIFHLVGLQMSDEVPFDITGQRSMLLAQFLFVALTKDALTLLVGCLDIFVGVILRDSHKAHTLW